MAVPFVFSLAIKLVHYLFLSNRRCPEILTRPGNKIQTQSVPPRHSFSAAKILKVDGFFKLLFALFASP